MKYIKRITLEERGSLKMWTVFLFTTTDESISQEFATLPEAVQFVNQKVNDEIELDTIPF